MSEENIENLIQQESTNKQEERNWKDDILNSEEEASSGDFSQIPSDDLDNKEVLNGTGVIDKYLGEQENERNMQKKDEKAAGTEQAKDILSVLSKPTSDELYVKEQKKRIANFDYQKVDSEYLDQQILKFSSGKGIVRLSAEEVDIVEMKSEQYETRVINGEVMGGKTFFIFGPSSFIRRIAFWMVTNRFYEFIMDMIILFNVIMMAIQPSFILRNTNSTLYNICDYVDIACIAIYTIDVLLKMLVKGVIIGKYTYLQESAWNIFDVEVVTAGWAAIIIQYAFPQYFVNYHLNASVVKGFKLVRVLMHFKIFQEIRAIVDSISQSLNFIVNVVSFLIFFFVVFGIMGVEFYQNSYNRKCFLLDAAGPQNCTINGAIQACYEAMPTQFCGKEGNVLGSFTCPGDQVCITEGLQSPNYGFTNFDNMFYSFLTMFQVVTLTGWTDLMYPLMNSENEYLTMLWFFVMIVILSFIIVNLFMAIITSLFAIIREKQIEEQVREREKKRLKQEIDPSKLSPIKRLRLRIKHLLTIQPLHYIPGIRLLKRRSEEIIQDPFFNFISLLFVSIHLIIQSTEYFGLSKTHLYILNASSVFFFFFYVGESFIRLFGSTSIYNYLSDVFNQMDIVLLIIQGTGIVLYSLGNEDTFLYKLGFLRALRLLPLLQMIKLDSTRQIRGLLNSTMGGVMPSLKMLLFMLYVIFIVAIIGHQLFGRRLFASDEDKAAGISSRDNFDTIPYGMITLFKIMTSDDWVISLYQAMSLQNDGWMAGIFFIGYYIVASYILLNIFTAVILEKFEVSEEERQEYKKVVTGKKPHRNVILEKIQRVAADIQSYVTKDPPNLVKQTTQHDDDDSNSSDDEDMHFNDNNPYVDEQQLKKHMKSIYSTDIEKYDENYDIVCFCLKSSNPFRKAVRFIVRNVWFDRVMAFIVILSTVAMMLEPAREADLTFDRPQWQDILIEVLFYSEWVFLVIFILEFFLKIISNGFLLTKDGSGYFEDPWNFFDFILIIVMFLTTALKSVLPSQLRIIRVLRTLRPLRVLRSIPGLKPILDSVYSSLFSMLTVLAASIYIMFLFGVAGVAIFNGKFHQCSDPTVLTKAQCTGFKPNELGVLTYLDWRAPRTNFDNIGWAMFSLTEVASLSDWATVMWRGMAVVGVDKQPQRDFAPYYSIFFILYILVGSFFILNIVIAVILDAYKANRDGHLLSEQNEWVDAKREMLLLSPKRLVKPPQGFFKGKFNPLLPFYKIMELRIPFLKSKPRIMEFLFGICISVNTAFLLTIGIKGFRTFFNNQNPNPWDNVLYITNWVFVGIYVFEMCLKILAYRKYYFLDAWNIFDFIVTIGSVIAAILTSFQYSNSILVLITAFISRIFRVGRVFKLIPYFSGLNFMFRTLVNSIPGIVNVTFLLIGLLIIYAIIALELYGAIKFQTGLNHNSNFRDLWTASVTLFRLATLDNWNILLNDVTNSLPYCTTTSTFDDCGSNWAYIYFFSYYVIGAYVFLNLVIAVILDNFAAAYNNLGTSDFYVNTFDFEAFIESWKVYDPDATGFIELSRLDFFIQHMYERLIDEQDDDVVRNNLAFSVFRNKKAFLLLKYELKLDLEPIVRSEAENNIFMILKNWVLKYYHRLLMHQKTKRRGKKERMISFHQTLYLLTKFAVPHKSFTYEESKEREDKLKVAMVNNAIVTIERFYMRYVKKRVENRLKLHENHAAALKELGKEDSKDPLRSHILHDLDSDTSSIVDEESTQEKDQINFIEYEFGGKKLDEIFNEYPNEQQLYAQLKMRSLKNRIVSLKNPINLANDPDFEPYTKYLLDPHYSEVLADNGFRLGFLPVCYLTKKELLYHLFKEDESSLRGVFYNPSILELLLTEYYENIMENLNENGRSMMHLTGVAGKESEAIEAKMQPITFENRNFTKVKFRERHYGSHYTPPVFPYPIHENSILNKLKEEEDGHFIFTKHCLHLSGVFGSTYSLQSNDLGLKDLMDTLKLIKRFDKSLLKNYGEVNDGIRYQLVRKGLYLLRPPAILKFFKTSAYKIFRNAALREKRISTVLTTEEERKTLYRESYRNYFKQNFIEEHNPNIDITVYCSSFDMKFKKTHFVDGVRNMHLNDFIPRQKYDIYALTFTNAFTTDEEKMRDYVETCMSGDYMIATVVNIRDMFLFIFVKEKFISGIDEDIHSDSMTYNNVLNNCGAVSAKIRINQTTFSFIGCSLPPNESSQKVSTKHDNTKERNTLLQKILDRMTNEHNIDVLLASDHLFIMGNMAYCLELPYAICREHSQKKAYNKILTYDQLTMERKELRVLRHFHEANIQFAPSKISLSERNRSMSYQDRILWKSYPGYSTSCVKYNSYKLEHDTSPVYGVYICNRLVYKDDHSHISTGLEVQPQKQNLLSPPKFSGLSIDTKNVDEEERVQYGIQFMSLELTGRKVDTKDTNHMILRPRFELISNAFPFTIESVITEKGCCGFNNLKITDRMIPFIQLRLNNLTLLKLQHIQVILRDGRKESARSRKIGRGVLPLYPLVKRFMENSGDEVLFSIPFYGYENESVHEMQLNGVVRFVEGESKSVRHIMTPANTLNQELSTTLRQEPSTTAPTSDFSSMGIQLEEPTPATNELNPFATL